MALICGNYRRCEYEWLKLAPHKEANPYKLLTYIEHSVSAKRYSLFHIFYLL